MSNADQKMDEISQMLDRSMLKNSKITKAELIEFIEQKWAEADDEKYRIYNSYIYASRMVNEYQWAKDYANMQRWLDEMDRHLRSGDNPAYIRDYYKAQCCLECGNEQKALEYLQKSYQENSEYLFTRSPKVAEFFGKFLGIEVASSEPEEEFEEEFYIELSEFGKFFNQESEICCIVFDKNGKKSSNLSLKQERSLDFLEANQSEILSAILAEILKHYPKWQEIYGYEGEYKEDFMPDVSDVSGFANLLELTHLYVMGDGESEFVRIGFSFNCSWDREHGLGVMSLRSEILAIGEADEAFC